MKLSKITSLCFLIFYCSTHVASAQTAPVKKPAAVKKTPVVKKPVVTAKKTSPTGASLAADVAEGKQLILKSDCLSCHRVDIKVVGPAYNDVAVKYPDTEENYNLLTTKILKGGVGVWGQLPMTPHPALPATDAKKIVKYILSLK